MDCADSVGDTEKAPLTVRVGLKNYDELLTWLFRLETPSTHVVKILWTGLGALLIYTPKTGVSI